MSSFESIERKKMMNQEIDESDAAILAAALVSENVDKKRLVKLFSCFNVNNVTPKEVFILASAIAQTGTKLELSSKIGSAINHDSIGSIFDTVSLVVMSVLASLGEKVVKLSSRKYGSFGSTITKLNMFEGFNASVSSVEFLNIAEHVGCAVLDNRGKFAPADLNLIELMRELPSTNVALLAVSFLAKKIVLGASIVVYDIKCGEGGFVGPKEEAYDFAKLLVEATKLAGIKSTAAIVTSMNQPISASLGAKAELSEIIRSLSSGEKYFDSDLMRLAKEIVEISLILSGAASGRAEASEKFDEAVKSGKALSKFKEIVLAFGGNFNSVNTDFSLSSNCQVSYIEAEESGYLGDVDTQKLYEYLRLLGTNGTDKLTDKNAGLILLVREGEHVTVGDKLARVIYSYDNHEYKKLYKDLTSAFSIMSNKPKLNKLFMKVFL